MRIAGLQKVSLIDYPERIAATVFLAGCNLDCGYCHNRWMLREAETPEALSASALMDWLAGRVGLLDGVCLTGGEPTLHGELADLLHAVKELGFAVKLDTNGTRPATMRALLDEGLLNYVAMDIKAPLNERYAAVAGVNVDLAGVRESMSLLRTEAPAFEFRTTVGPEVTESDLFDMAALFRDGAPWVLQAHSLTPYVRDRRPATDLARLEELAAQLVATAPGARLRGA